MPPVVAKKPLKLQKKKKSAEDVTAAAKLLKKEQRSPRNKRIGDKSPRAKHKFAHSPSPKNQGYEPLPPSPDMKQIKERARVEREEILQAQNQNMLDFDIEKVWQEMERIKNRKEENAQFIDNFRKDFYGKDPDAFHGECSPTRRLM